MKKILTLCVLFIGLLALTACGDSNGDGDVVEIHVVFSKMEVTTEFEEMLEIFNSEHDDIQITLLPTEDGQGVIERVRIQYAAGEAVTLMHIDAGFVPELEPQIRDLSDQPWISRAMDGTLDFATREDGRILGMPASVEGFGIVYNRDVIRSVIADFDPQDIRSVDDFVALLDTLEAADVNSMLATPSLDWSLGFHLMNAFLATQSEDLDENLEFLDGLLNGTVDLYQNDRFQAFMDILRIMFAYNMFAETPLDPQFDDGIVNLADGNVAMWFQGNWIHPPMYGVNPDGDYGFLPVPMSNNSDDFANRRISVDVPQFWVVDEYLSNPEQQEAALTFLDWMVSSQEGQYHSAMSLGLAPVMDGANYIPQDPLSIAMVDYLERGEALPWVISYFSGGILTTTGGGVQQYALGLITAEELATIIEDAFEALD